MNAFEIGCVCVRMCVYACKYCVFLLLTKYTLMSGSDGDCVCVPPPSGTHHSGDSEAMLLHPQQVKVQHSSVTFQIVFKGKCDGGVVNLLLLLQ